MRIADDQGLERALAEFHRLKDAPDGSAEAARRHELDGAIQDYYARRKETLRPGRPAHTA
jgi:hypothetical protein